MAIMIAPQQGQLGKHRSPFAVLLLSLITFGIYYLYWYYQVNCEIRRHAPDVSVSPGLAVLAQFIPIVGTVSSYRTAMRVRKLYMYDQLGGGPSGAVTLLILFLFPIGYPWLVQGGLNEHWEMQTIATSRLAQQQPTALQAPSPSAFSTTASQPAYAPFPVEVPINTQPKSPQFPSGTQADASTLTSEEKASSAGGDKPAVTLS